MRVFCACVRRPSLRASLNQPRTAKPLSVQPAPFVNTPMNKWAKHPSCQIPPNTVPKVRRIAHWFDVKFTGDVNAYILTERLEKTISGGGAPDPQTLRTGREHLKFHLEYLTWLLENRDWLAGHTFSLADIAAGAHISCLDYLDEINWEHWPALKEWYQKLKSRPSFRPPAQRYRTGSTPCPTLY